jgi:2-polyprenyl-3-methyl-5-hydroxy-6-metoxy-1,4-benzoquinol methylase
LLICPEQEYWIIRCPECGFGWTEPQIDEDVLPRYYPADYLGDTAELIDGFQSGTLQHTSSWRMEVEKIRLLESIKEKGSILDVGCGEGKFLWALDSTKWQCTGVELSENVVSLVRNRFPDLELICGSIDSPTLLPNSFDVITFWHVLEHLSDPKQVLRRAHTLLRDRGYAIFSLPNLDSLQAHWFRQYWYAFSDVPRHLFHYSPRSLARLLREAAFSTHSQHFFSRAVNFHCWKHSLRAWSAAISGSQVPYLIFKPLLHLLPWYEALTGRYGIFTLVAQKNLDGNTTTRSGQD